VEALYVRQPDEVNGNVSTLQFISTTHWLAAVLAPCCR
jgi:hypothetical protein